MHHIKNEKGIAMILVLGAVTLLTLITTQYAYNANINYNLAKNEVRRTQAYFLALSAINLMKLEIKLERDFKAQVSASPAAGMVAGNLGGPLCQQFPVSTAILRSIFLGQAPPEGSEKEGEGAGGGEEGGEKAAAGSPAPFIGAMQVEAAKDFLAFKGDFEGVCEDESAKFNLNIFAGKNPAEQVLSGANEYDMAKQMLTTLLSQKEFEKLFPKEREKAISDIVRNIADWVDEDDRMSEYGGVSTGSENSIYAKGIMDVANTKNGKYLTLDELYLVADVSEDWFYPLKDKFTIYGEGQVNVCTAPNEVVAALILQYANSNANVPDVNPEDKLKLDNLVSVVKMGCSGVQPNVTDIASALDAALGVGTGAGAAEAGGAGGAGSSSSGFASMITTENRYFTLLGTGIVGAPQLKKAPTQVKIRAVIDTADPRPDRWKIVYWREE